MRYHCDLAGAFANLGVRILFIISGYLITTLLLREQDKDVDDPDRRILHPTRVQDSSGGPDIHGRRLGHLLARPALVSHGGSPSIWRTSTSHIRGI